MATNESTASKATSDEIKENVKIHTLILDCSCLNYVDTVGIKTIDQVAFFFKAAQKSELKKFMKIGIFYCKELDFSLRISKDIGQEQLKKLIKYQKVCCNNCRKRFHRATETEEY